MFDSLETRHLVSIRDWLMRERNDALLFLTRQDDPIALAKASGRVVQLTSLVDTIQYVIDERSRSEEGNG